MTNSLMMAGVKMATAAPQLSLTVSPSLQTVLRGVGVVLIAVLLILLLVSKVKFGRGGGMGGQMRAGTIIMTLLVAALLMDVQMFVTLLNWVIALLYEVAQWVGDFLKGTTDGGTSGGTVSID